MQRCNVQRRSDGWQPCRRTGNGNRAASWSDGTGHARTARHVDGVTDTDIVEDEEGPSDSCSSKARGGRGEKKAEAKQKG